MSKVELSDKSKNVYFDTSIYNRLFDDPEKERVLRLIKEKTLNVIPSVVNLCELLMTSVPNRKTELIRIYQEIRNDFHPLKPFTWLLKDSVESVEKDLKDWEINYPIDITDETENICRDLIRQKGIELEPYFQGARDFIQDVKKREKLADELQYFAYVDSKSGQKIMIELFDQICTSMGKVCQLDEDNKLAIITSPLMPWKYYLESYAYLFYRRAFQDKWYGKQSNPGPSDLEQCVYLFWSGKLIIEDNVFIAFVSRLKEIRNYDVQIMDYSGFRDLLLNEIYGS